MLTGKSHSSPLEQSRKWALYYMGNILFKTYFKLNTLNLCKNVLRPLQAANTDMPPLSAFPKSHQVTFKFYNGVLRFLEEDYSAAEEFLESAYSMCFAGEQAQSNLEGILMYLIPTKLVTTHSLPSLDLLKPYPNLERLFLPIRSAILRADLTAFNTALEEGNEEFVKRRIYLTLERGRDVILRNIFRKVFLAGGFEPAKEGETGPPLRRTRVPVKEFAAALQIAGAEVGDGEGGVDSDEVECLLANAIYKVRLTLSHPRAPSWSIVVVVL
nr:protein csn12 like [Quercus suber]